MWQSSSRFAYNKTRLKSCDRMSQAGGTSGDASVPRVGNAGDLGVLLDGGWEEKKSECVVCGAICEGKRQGQSELGIANFVGPGPKAFVVRRLVQRAVKSPKRLSPKVLETDARRPPVTRTLFRELSHLSVKLFDKSKRSL